MDSSAYLSDEYATEKFGRLLAEAIGLEGAVVFLHGNLGMGKTTLCRGVMGFWGHQGAVKSPTYTLVEPYIFEGVQIYHFDLYRLGDPEELEFLGIRDYFEERACCLIEWPEKGAGMLPVADLELFLTEKKPGREIKWSKNTQKGCMIADRIVNKLNG